MNHPRPIRVGIVGAGFWARYQIAGWREVPGVSVAALADTDRPKAEALARALRVPAVHAAAEALLDREAIDVLDVLTGVDAHAPIVELAAARGVPVICQKPMAPDLATAERMVATCRAAGVPFLIHENWRWQAPIRALKEALATPGIGRAFRARLDFLNGFPVFRNQPFLATLDRFILADMGSHILDVARFLFGEADSVFCRTSRVHAEIRGEDVATVVLGMKGSATTREGATVTCNLAYAENALERHRFPETLAFVETEAGSVELAPDGWLKVTTASGTLGRRVVPERFAWADPAYDLVQSAIVPCCRDLAAALRGEKAAETAAADNLRTARLVFAAYDSAERSEVVRIAEDRP